MESLLKKFQNIVLKEGEERDLIVDHEEVERAEVTIHHSVLMKLLTTKTFNRPAVKHTLKRAWGVGERTRMVELDDNLFQVIFETEEEMERIIDGGPWCFDNLLVLFTRWEKGLHRGNVKFEEAHFWVQVWNLPMEYRTPGVAKVIGTRLGNYLGYDSRSLVDGESSFIRIRVGLAVEEPLLRGGRLPMKLGETVLLDYKYERLPSSCWYCGLMGHEDKGCRTKVRDEAFGTLKTTQYGPWLKGSRVSSKEKLVKGTEGRRRAEAAEVSAGGSRAAPMDGITVQQVSNAGSGSGVEPKNLNSVGLSSESSFRRQEGEISDHGEIGVDRSAFESKNMICLEGNGVVLSNSNIGTHLDDVEQMEMGNSGLNDGPVNVGVGLDLHMPSEEAGPIVSETGLVNTNIFTVAKGGPTRRLNKIKAHLRRGTQSGEKKLKQVSSTEGLEFISGKKRILD